MPQYLFGIRVKLQLVTPYRHKINWIRRGTAAFLTFWLSGLLFALSCQVHGAQLAASACPLSKAHDHCPMAAAKSAGRPAIYSQDDGSLTECCGFLPVVFDKARKVEKNGHLAFTPPKSAAAYVPIPLPIHRDFRRSPVLGLVVSRHDLFIRNCVFRI
jgi:hypothetical protein